MDYISEILKRADIQHIRGFLVYGSECEDIHTKGYSERLDDSHNQLIESVKSKFPTENEFDDFNRRVCEYATDVQDVYMEVGLQCGIKLAAQMYKNMKTDTSDG